MCAICDNGVETSRHLFFYCCMVRQIVRKITRWWDVPYVEVELYEDWTDIAYLLLDVDVILLTTSCATFLKWVITSLRMFLSQSKYAKEIPERAQMQHCNPCPTSVDTESKLGPDGDSKTLWYVHGTFDHGLQLHVSTTTQLLAYTDAGRHITKSPDDSLLGEVEERERDRSLEETEDVA
ncbi:hypothetical protein Tco_1043470 [Tanacetum coccineum]|uniref:Reverse transcriptase zinc-binding domain-containing protein n=1 Tax=Tanacetum coccineum TaxID=301880 RepID=A0ABQ5GM46_9ASTR